MASSDPSPSDPTAAETSLSLLGLLRENEPAAWDRLVALYSPLIYYWCRGMGIAEQEMPDLFQDVFQSVARGIPYFRREPSSGTFRGWLRVVTRNKVHDYYRKARHEPRAAGGTQAQVRLLHLADPVGSDGGAEEGQETADQSAYRELFRRALTLVRPHFQEQTWQAFWRVTIEGKSAQEAADELSMTPGAVRVAKSRVLQRLRQELGDLAGQPTEERPA
jgi:RNA polymerase sigma-70 factor (ECF subfamily)